MALTVLHSDPNKTASGGRVPSDPSLPPLSKAALVAARLPDWPLRGDWRGHTAPSEGPWPAWEARQYFVHTWSQGLRGVLSLQESGVADALHRFCSGRLGPRVGLIWGRETPFVSVCSLRA